MTPATAPPPRLLTAAEFARLPDDGRKTELVKGRIVEVPPTYPFYGYVCSKIGRIVGNFIEAQNLGRVMTNDSGVLTERDPDTLRGADVCYYRFKRLPPGPLPEEQYFTVAPELVFEVLSPSDRWPKVMEKVSEYLEVGVTVVCVVIPSDRTAVVYRNDPKPEPLAADADLVLTDVLPGFRVRVAELLKLPKQVMCVFGLCVGYAADGVTNAVKPRLPQSAIVHQEHYSGANDREIRKDYDDVLGRYSREQEMSQYSWTERVLSRTQPLKAMSGRHALREALAALGIPAR